MNSTTTTTFGVGDLVDVQGRSLRCYGEIKELRGTALVHFKEPRRPNRGGGRLCDECGRGSGLSQNIMSGEVVCMASGCGHRHGFDERDEEIAIGLLILHLKVAPVGQESTAAATPV